MDNLTNVCEATSQSQEFDNFRPTHRKGKKLLAEKKRRARINNCLMQIRRLVCEEKDEQDTDIDKMEKAEILEKTLEVLTRLRHENPQISNTASTHKAMAIRYASGFSLCAEESIRYIHNSRLVPSEVKVQLQNHLRAIARRVESTVNVDKHDLNPKQGLSTMLSSSPSSDKVMAGEIFSSSMDNSSVSGHFLGDVSEGSDRYITSQLCLSTERSDRYITSPLCYSTERSDHYITSPLCYSTPIPYQHGPFIKSNGHLQTVDRKLFNYSSEACKYNVDQRKKSARGRAAQSPGQSAQIKQAKQTSLSSDFQLEKSEGYFSDSSQSKQCCLPQSSSFFLSSVTSDTSFSNSSSLVTNSSVLSTTPTLAYRTMYPYPRFEPRFTTPDILGESIQVDSNNLLTLPSESLDLCVKRTDEQQISTDGVWRPW